ncbi:MAG: type II toxin-antitoxin system HicB family antitoxin [Gammaproteobacteria bacterium]|nr:type II toxin-antitoxin system HicB family antitoxin [Gammaproteobacteria bacterium]
MSPKDRYLKVVEWSDEDGCYVGRCPDLMLGGVHGMNEKKVFMELCQVVDEWIRIHEMDGRPLPAPSAVWENPKQSVRQTS